jgi:hypothetical protein
VRTLPCVQKHERDGLKVIIWHVIMHLVAIGVQMDELIAVKGSVVLLTRSDASLVGTFVWITHKTNKNRCNFNMVFLS